MLIIVNCWAGAGFRLLSKGYANWAKVFNLKLVAETVNYLSENNISDISTLDAKISELSDKLYEKKEISKAN